MRNYLNLALDFIGSHNPHRQNVITAHKNILKINSLSDIFFLESNGGFYLLSHELLRRSAAVSYIFFEKTYGLNGPRIMDHLVTYFDPWPIDFFDFFVVQLSAEQRKKLITKLEDVDLYKYVTFMLKKYNHLLDDEEFISLIKISMRRTNIFSLNKIMVARKNLNVISGLHTFYFRDTATIKYIFAKLPVKKDFFLSKLNHVAVNDYKNFLVMKIGRENAEERFNLFVSYEKNPHEMIKRCRLELRLAPMFSAKIFALCIFLCDDFLMFK